MDPNQFQLMCQTFAPSYVLQQVAGGSQDSTDRMVMGSDVQSNKQPAPAMLLLQVHVCKLNFCQGNRTTLGSCLSAVARTCTH